MKILPPHRKRLIEYLKKFYQFYPDEKYTIFHFVRYFKERLKNNKDTWMGVTGDTGVGKSLFVIMSQILFGRPYDLEKNVAYIPYGDEIVNKLDELNFQTFLIDESAKEMRAVNWHSKAQQNVNTKAMTDRFQNNWVFLNMPNFNEFTKSMRTTNIQFRAIVLFRTKQYARVLIQMRSRNWRSIDRWYDKRAEEVYEKIIRRKRGELNNDEILQVERSLPNTVMDFIVPNLELILPEVTDEYEALKIDSRKEKDELLADPKNIYKEKYEELLKRVTKVLHNNELQLGKIRVTKKEIAESIGVSTSTLNKYLNIPNNEPLPVVKRNI